MAPIEKQVVIMIPTETISVINRYTENHEDKYQSTIIHGVFWFGNVLSSLSAEGYNAANQFVIRIPAKSASIPYIPSQQWNSQNHNGWTLQEGDYIARGEVTTVASPAALRESGLQVIAIKGYAENLRSKTGLAHWKVVGA